jgi:hypothetical protein
MRGRIEGGVVYENRCALKTGKSDRAAKFFDAAWARVIVGTKLEALTGW